MRITKYLINAILLRKKFGNKGLFSVAKLFFSKKPLVEFYVNKHNPPIYLRNYSTDYATFSQIFYDEEYNFPFSKIPKVIIDCGANIGLSAIYFKIRFPNAMIIAIEPDSGNYEILLKNTAAYPDIICIKAGIWNTSTYLEVVDINRGEWGFMVKPVEYSTESTIKGIGIKEIISSFNLENIDILKIDIEGSEKELFELGQDEWLPFVNTMIIETHDRFKKGTAKSIFSALSKYDYSLSLKGENLLFDLVKP